MKKASIAVLVSGGGTNLQALIDAQNSGLLRSGAIQLVVSNNPYAYALKRAEDNGIPSAVLSAKLCGGAEAFEAQLTELLEENHIDLIVLAGFMTVLSSGFTSHFEKRIINVHPSLIPAFCGKGYYGLRVHEAALSYGVKVTGATVHYVNEIPDGGQIILQKAVSIREGDTPEKLQKRVMRQAEWKILPAAAEMICAQLMNAEEN